MLQFVFKHPVSVLIALIIHVLLVAVLTVQWLEPEPLKASSLSPMNKESTTQEITEVKPPNEPLKTFAVDASKVQEQIKKIKAQQEAKRQEKLNLALESAQEKQRLQQLREQQEAERIRAEKERKKAEAERKRAQAERKKAEAERKKAQQEADKVRAEKKRAQAERKKAEQARKEALKAEQERLQAQKKAQQAETQRLAEEARQKELAKQLAQKKAEQAALEKAAEEARKKREAEEAAARLQQQLAEEARQKQEEEKRKQLLSMKASYVSSIAAKVKNNWRTPARISSQAQCDLKITQTRTGSISAVEVLNCNRHANQQFKTAAEKAVYRAAPLPTPEVPELFEPQIRFQFTP